MVFAVTYAMRDFKVAIDTLDKGFVTPRAMVTHRIGLDELPAAFEALRQRSDQCKVMVDPWRTPATAP